MDIAKIFEERFQLEKEYLGIDKAVHSIEPVVSVCVATYQHVNYIEECVEGVLMQQTTFPIEIIIGEDGSSDGTREKCIAYAEEHPDKIRLYLRDRESSQLFDEEGTYITRFNGKWNRRAARGRYIAMCEGDDYWTDPLKLQKQVDFLEANPAFSSCFHPVQILKGNEFVEDHITRKVPDVTSTKDLLEGNFIHTPSVVFRNFFDAAHSAKFIEATHFSPIGDLLLHIFNAQFGKIYRLEEPMAVYRLGAGTWSSLSKAVRIQKTIKAYLSLIQLLEKTEDFEAVYTRIKNYFLQLQVLSKPQPPKKTLTLEEVSIKTHLQLVLRKIKQKLL